MAEMEKTQNWILQFTTRSLPRETFLYSSNADSIVTVFDFAYLRPNLIFNLFHTLFA